MASDALQPVSARAHVALLLKAPVQLLQLQLVLAAELALVPVLLLLQQPQLPELLAPGEERGTDLPWNVASRTALTAWDARAGSWRRVTCPRHEGDSGSICHFWTRHE